MMSVIIRSYIPLSYVSLSYPMKSNYYALINKSYINQCLFIHDHINLHHIKNSKYPSNTKERKERKERKEKGNTEGDNK
jgi:hypothetical protein